MTIEAFRELSHDSGRMRGTVAILALRNRLVFFLVAERAVECGVLHLAGGQGLQNFTMTGPAEPRRNVRGIADRYRRMRRMAFLAVGGGNIRRMRLMTLRTLRYLAVDVMTRGASYRAVFRPAARNHIGFGPVAVEALKFVLEANDQRGMRVPVAIEAAGHAKVRFLRLGVALAAKRERLLHLGRVPHMAPDTGHASMFPSRPGPVIHRSAMAFLAIVGTRRERRGRRSAALQKKHHYECNANCRNARTIILRCDHPIVQPFSPGSEGVSGRIFRIMVLGS